MRKRFLTYSLCVLTLFTASVTTAQVAEKSRLRIGEKPKVTTPSTTLSSYIANPNLPSEINYNKSQAINTFYRQLLLSNRSTHQVTNHVAAKSVMNETTEDALFSNATIHVSNIYPNPANAVANIEYELRDNNAKAELTFYDMLARKVSTYELNSFDRKLRVDTRNWESGIYLYQLIIDGKKVATKKLLVRHN
ncbi:MAG: hypothetical protein ACI9V1_003050 [Spirosomataceae bacterium]|jgi:hypothetical protein